MPCDGTRCRSLGGQNRSPGRSRPPPGRRHPGAAPDPVRRRTRRTAPRLIGIMRTAGATNRADRDPPHHRHRHSSAGAPLLAWGRGGNAPPDQRSGRLLHHRPGRRASGRPALRARLSAGLPLTGGLARRLLVGGPLRRGEPGGPAASHGHARLLACRLGAGDGRRAARGARVSRAGHRHRPAPRRHRLAPIGRRPLRRDRRQSRRERGTPLPGVARRAAACHLRLVGILHSRHLRRSLSAGRAHRRARGSHGHAPRSLPPCTALPSACPPRIGRRPRARSACHIAPSRSMRAPHLAASVSHPPGCGHARSLPPWGS